MNILKRKTVLSKVEDQLYQAEHWLLIAEAELENAQGKRDTLLKRRDRLQSLLDCAKPTGENNA